MTDYIERREKIEKVLAGKSVPKEGSLSFSYPESEFFVKAGEKREFGFTIAGSEKMPLLGIASAKDIRMKCLTEVFVESPAKIRFCFDSSGLDEGECVRGEFQIISNQGEYSLPYMIHIIPEVFETSLGQMKNLFHFTNLAKTNWEEAVSVFYRKDFGRMLTGNDRQYANIYRAMRKMPAQEQAVEEFLIAVRKKQKVSYTAKPDALMLSAGKEVIQEKIILSRNGWGYTKLTVEIEGEFLHTEKVQLTDDDFLGNGCTLMLLIDGSMLHAGSNFGKIHIYNEYVSLTIPVCVREGEAGPGRQRKRKRERVYQFYRTYLQYSTGKITKQAWLKQTERILDDIGTKRRKSPVRELFLAHIFLTKEKYRDAEKILEQVQELRIPQELHMEIHCYYLYLMTLVRQEEAYTRHVADEVREIYENHPDHWRIAWLLLYLDEEYSNLSRKWLFLEQQYEMGCHSPVWYMEAAQLARKNPAFLMKLTPFVMQILQFMTKYDYLTKECIGQIHYLAGRSKGYLGQMYAVLKTCYDRKPDLETLRAICALLIKGGKTGPEYVFWYREGIRRELWLTRLYEYYLLSIEIGGSEEIPDAALRYFSYKSELPYDRMAYLYAYVIERKNERPELYRSYLPDMERFLLRQLEKGRMSRSIGCIWRDLIQEEIIGEDVIVKYAKNLFLQEVKVHLKDIRFVIVVHRKLKGEIICPVMGQIAYVPIYDPDYALIFENRLGHRFAGQNDHEQRIISYPEEMLAEILPKDAGVRSKEIGILLYQCERIRMYSHINKDSIRYERMLWMSDEIQDEFRMELQGELLRYYAEGEEQDAFDAFLEELAPEQMSERERIEVLKHLILRGMYEKAYGWIRRYGMEGLSARLLFRLCSRLLQGGEEASDDMNALAYQAFSAGKYDETILRYLSVHFAGTLPEMCRLWHACGRFSLINRDLDERLLLQMLFSGERMEEEADVFVHYLKGSADDVLKNACLEYFAAGYFIDGRELDERIWKELLRKGREEEEWSRIGRLAVLEYLSEKEEHDEEEKRIIRSFLEEMILKQGFILGFFRKFKDIAGQMAYYDHHTFLEYRTRSENPMILHYMRKSHAGGGEYHTEELKSCCAGIYSRSFLLFEGETVEYYISEKQGEREVLAVSGTLKNEDTGGGMPKEHISMINAYIMAVSEQENEKAERILEEEGRMEFFAERLFAPL